MAGRDEYEEPFVRIVTDFLNSDEWAQNQKDFLEGHADQFCIHSQEEKVEGKYEFSHQQYNLFKTFQYWADDIVGGILSNINCTDEQFVQMCRERFLNHGVEDSISKKIENLLSIVDAITSFPRFEQLMYDTRCCLRANPQYTLDMREWELQLALAQSIVHCYDSKTLPESDVTLIPWAQAVIAMNDALTSSGGIDLEEEENELETLTNNLTVERFNVEILVANRLSEETCALREEVSTQEPFEETTLSVLLTDLGKTQLAASRQRDALRKDATNIDDEQYEEIYLMVRNRINCQTKKSDAVKKVTHEIRQRLSAVDEFPSLVEDIASLIWLEDRLSRIQKDIESELQNPGTVHLANPVPTPTSLHIETAFDDTETEMASVVEFFQQSPYSPKNRGPMTPKEAKEAITGMQHTLRHITENRELQKMQAKLESESRKARQTPTTKESIIKITQLAAENEFLKNQALYNDWETNSDATEDEDEVEHQFLHQNDINASGEKYDDAQSEATEEGEPEYQSNDFSSKSNSINRATTKANTIDRTVVGQPQSPHDLLRETERLRSTLQHKTNIHFASSTEQTQTSNKSPVVNPASLRFLTHKLEGLGRL